MRSIRNYLRRIVYHNLIIKQVFVRIYYRRWFKRVKAGEGIIQNENLHAYFSENKITKYTAREEIKFKKPFFYNALGEQHEYFLSNDFFNGPSQFVVVDDSYLIGPEAIPVDNKGQIFTNTVYDQVNLLHKCSPGKLQNFSKEPADFKVDVAVSIINLYCNGVIKNYFHWIVDSLLLLESIQHFEKATGKKVRIFINANPSEFQVQSLNLLGFKDYDIIEYSFNKVEVACLLVPLFRRTPTQKDWLFPKSGLQWLRGKILSKVKLVENSPKRIYISRSKAGVRKVINEAEVIDLLSEYGFHVFNLEELSFENQVQLFYNAEIVISPHGAALTNIVFMRNGTKVIELLNIDESYSYSLYFVMANALELQYGLIDVKKVNDSGAQKYDIIVDVEQLKEINL